jgi:hypothetical protein
MANASDSATAVTTAPVVCLVSPGYPGLIWALKSSSKGQHVNPEALLSGINPVPADCAGQQRQPAEHQLGFEGFLGVRGHFLKHCLLD